MADIEDKELDIVEEQIDEVEEEAEDQADEQTGEQDDEPLTVSFGDDEPEPDFSGPAPEWVKEVRRQNAELKKRLRELETVKEAAAPDIGPEPTLESCDYDEAEFKAAWRDWNAKAAEVETSKAAQEAEARKVQEAFEQKVAAYNEAKAALPVDDFDIAEAVVVENFDATQQGLLVKLAKQPALFAYALGKNPTKAKALAAIKDPVDFIAAAVRMETEMKQGKKAPAPERLISGGVAGATAVDNRLEALRAEAAKTGDFSKVWTYRASLNKGG